MRWSTTTSASSAPTPTIRSASTARSAAPASSPATPAGGPGQLEDELAEEAWIIEPPQREEIFTSEPGDLWAAVLRRKGHRYALLATMPPDPSLN